MRFRLIGNDSSVDTHKEARNGVFFVRLYRMLVVEFLMIPHWRICFGIDCCCYSLHFHFMLLSNVGIVFIVMLF